MRENQEDNLLLKIIQQELSAKDNELKNNCLYYSKENLSVSELSNILGKDDSEIISYFWSQGKVINRSQVLSFELLEDYCQSLKIKLKKQEKKSFNSVIEKYLTKINSQFPFQERPPIISIMGHIDHGKTTLLDTIRQTNIQQREVGGITQKITVSQVEVQGKKLTFLDTPGHSDFIYLRQQGISLTDIVVLVIEAKDGVMVQTSEIINYLLHYKIPVIIFINYKESTSADYRTNLDRIKTQCQERDLTPEEWISGNAKEKKSIQRLLQSILDLASLAEFKTNYQGPTYGVAIDSYFLPKLGKVAAELLIQGGYLKEKDNIFLQGKLGKVKEIHNIYNQKVEKVGPSDLAKVIGNDFLVDIGEKFVVIDEEKTKNLLEKELASHSRGPSNKLSSPTVSDKKKNINLFLIADSQNSLEILNNLIKKKSSANLLFSSIYTSVGKLGNSELELARLTQSTILFFGLLVNSNQEKFLKENNIPFFNSKIVYEIEKELDNIINTHQEKKIAEKLIGEAQVKKVFEFSRGNIAGCQVVSGKISRSNQIHVFRGKEKKKIFTGSIKGLESKNKRVVEVISGQECGIVLKGFDDFQTGDKIISFQIVEENANLG